MSDPNLPETLGSKLSELESRLQRLENANKAGFLKAAGDQPVGTVLPLSGAVGGNNPTLSQFYFYAYYGLVTFASGIGTFIVPFNPAGGCWTWSEIKWGSASAGVYIGGTTLSAGTPTASQSTITVALTAAYSGGLTINTLLLYSTV